MIKKIICLLLVLSLVLQGGCWSRKELSDLAIIMAAGIDRTPDGNIRLTVQIARPRAFGGGTVRPSAAQENNAWVLSQTGETVLDAERELEKKVSRKIYWGHMVILVLGQEAAREGIRSLINFFSRSPNARETLWVLVARGKAEDLLNSHSQLENTSAQSTGSVLRDAVGVPVMLKDLIMMLASKGTNPTLPFLELTASGAPQGPGMKENIPEAKNKQQKVTETHAEITLTGTGVFKDDRLVGQLDVPDTRGLLWLTNKIGPGEITIPSPAEPGKKISVNITRGKTKIEPFYDGQNARFEIKITMEGDLWEQQSTEDLTDPKIFAAIEKRMAQRIEQRVRSVLDKAQFDYGLDIFAFGESFHRKYKKEWAALKDRWDEVFANADINIAVEAHIRRTGLTTKRIF
ncbi:spore germination protein KC [Desulfohalotomaculum tongense]|uniref:Ger(x)C family spore germination protein n=1 Tax=Desulforadius tongensis TaxID=1216062 RepID=UPI00195E0C0F|nr:Ger(x)C family spore germination protein [Desulforadius tongensis]MBM7856121.1 spore germination protein KC [Desulforadius tongensis]